MSVSLPTGYDGVIISGENPPVTNLPIAFVGIVLSFNDATLFINVKNPLGRPMEGVEVTVDNLSDRIGFTDSGGNVSVEVPNPTGLLSFRKEKTFNYYSFNTGTEGTLLNFIFKAPLMS